MDILAKQKSEKLKYIKFWRDETDYIIQKSFRGVTDEILFRLFRVCTERLAGFYYDKYRHQSQTYEGFLQDMKSVYEMNDLKEMTANTMQQFLQLNKNYYNQNLFSQFAIFGIALADRLMDYKELSLNEKLESYQALKVSIQKEAVAAMDQPKYAIAVKPVIDYLDIQIADCKEMIADGRGKSSNNLLFFIRDKKRFSDKALDDIAEHLLLHGIIRDKQLFIDFISAKDVQVAVHPEHLLYYTETIRVLYQEYKVIRLNRGKAFLKHTLNHIQDFSMGIAKSTESQYLSNLASKNPPNSNKMDVLSELIGLKIK